MPLRKIAQVGHPVLRQQARALSRDELASTATQRFIDDLIATMRDANGAGLAANQVYEPIQICAIEVRDNPRYPYKPNIPLTLLVNPVLTPVDDETFDNYEGCLSVPNLRGVVRRHVNLRVQAMDRDGNDIDEVVHASGVARSYKKRAAYDAMRHTPPVLSDLKKVSLLQSESRRIMRRYPPRLSASGCFRQRGPSQEPS